MKNSNLLNKYYIFMIGALKTTFMPTYIKSNN
jgi:hypothetical protein